MNLARTMIFAKDMSRMIAFYRDGLGLRFLEERSNEGWAEFDAGGVLLALHAIPPEIARDLQITTPPKARESTPIKLVFASSDVVEARAHLAAHGAVMFEPRSWGACDGLDPEGNVFQIVEM
jgi:catechol 2,3-dioxygenase-like lactoylglutathione lyase family enzyme